MITLNAIEERLSTFANLHYFLNSYGFGAPDEVDLDKFTAFPTMYVVYTGATYDEGQKVYAFEVYVFDRPTEQEQKSTNRREVVSDSEQCLEDLVADVTNGGNVFLFNERYFVESSSIQPIIDERSNLLSGALLDLSISVPWEASACNLPIDGVSPVGGEIAYARRGLLRILTQDGTTDVRSVNTIKVTNGTLTDEGNGVVSLDITGGTGAVDSVNGQTGAVVLDTGDIAEGSNLYYTDGRVDARVTALDLATKTYVDTAVGVEEAARISADGTLQTQITTNAGDITALEAADYVNTLNGVDGTVTIAGGTNVSVSTVGQTITISSSGGGGGGHSFGKVAVPGQTTIEADSGNDTLNINAGNGIDLTTNATTDTLTIAVDATTTDIPEGTNEYYTAAKVDAKIAAASVTDLTDVTSAGSGAIITTAERSKLAGIAAGAEVNVNADWNAASGDEQILNKPTLAAVATSGAYGDLSGTPTIPAQFFNVVSDAATSITLDTGDEGRYIRCTAASAVTVTVPSGKFQADDEIIIEQAGTGQVEIAAGAGVTINNSSANTKKTAEQFAVIALKCTATDVFTLTGERELV